MIFEELEIYGDPRAIEENPPEVMVELFDFDKFVSTHSHWQNLRIHRYITDFKLNLYNCLEVNIMKALHVLK